MKSLILLFTLITTTIPVKSIEFPSDITMCDRSTPEFTDCMHLFMEDLRSHFKSGYPEIGFPVVDPMNFSQVFFQLSTFNVTAKNIVISGTSNFILRNLTTSDDEVILDVFLPHATAITNYHIEGKLMMIDLNADGIATFDIDGITDKTLIKVRKVKRNGKEYINFDNYTSFVNVKAMKVELDRLFGDNVELTRTTNQMINENMNDLIQQFQPLVSEMVGGFLYEMLKPVFTQFPLDVIKYFN